MSKMIEDLKDWVTYLLSALGISLNWGSVNAFIIFLLTVIFFIYQILHKRQQKITEKKESEKLDLEIKILKDQEDNK